MAQQMATSGMVVRVSEGVEVETVKTCCRSVLLVLRRKAGSGGSHMRPTHGVETKI